MRHAAAMLVAAMEQHDRALGGLPDRRPVAVEDLGAVMGAEGALLRHPLRQLRKQQSLVHEA